MFDCHTDTVLKAYEKGKKLNNRIISDRLDKLKVYRKSVICWAIFNEGELKMKDIMNIIHILQKESEKSSHFCFCKNSYEKNNAHKMGKTAVYVTIEGLGNTEDFLPQHIFELKKAGVKMASLTWNNENFLCGGADTKNAGITPLGKETLKNMERAKMMLDVSHISDKGLYEGFSHYCLPVCASHSNVRSVKSHPRNLTDEQIKRIIMSGGVIGINFYPEFTGDRKILVKHIERILNLGGEKHIGIGTDFDGINKTFPDLENHSHIYNLAKELFGKNYRKDFIYDFTYNNFNDIFNNFEILK